MITASQTLYSFPSTSIYIYIYLILLTTQWDRCYYYSSPFHKGGTERLTNSSKVVQLLSGKSTRIWIRRSGLEHSVPNLCTVQCWGPVWLTISPYWACTANPRTFNLPYFFSTAHFHHSTYQVTGFHETISSQHIEWKQMDRGPRWFPHVWISGGTLSPICFYLGNDAKDWGKKSVSMNPWVLF